MTTLAGDFALRCHIASSVSSMAVTHAARLPLQRRIAIALVVDAGRGHRECLRRVPEVGLLSDFGAPGRTRTGTPPFGIAADFKSAVSTGFTTGAGTARCGNARRTGGGGRNRTGVHGFAGRCITTLSPRRGCRNTLQPGGGSAPEPNANRRNKKGSNASLSQFGAGDESRTRDLNLGKVALYQLSYSRGQPVNIAGDKTPVKPTDTTNYLPCKYGQALRR